MNLSSEQKEIPGASAGAESRCQLQPVAPYNLSLAARFFALRTAGGNNSPTAGPADERVPGQKQYKQLTLHAVLNGRPVQIVAQDTGEISSPNLTIRWRELFWSAERKRHNSFPNKNNLPFAENIRCTDIKRHLQQVLSLETDLHPFYEKLAEHEQLKPLRESLRGLKPVLTPTVFDAALWAIVGQQVTLSFALKIKERLAKRYGRRFDSDEGELYAAPTPASLAGSDVKELRALQLSQRKAEYVLTLSRAVAQGLIDLEALRSDPYELAGAKLTDLRGIGQWTANYILMRGAGHPDALPLGDAGLRRAVRRAYALSHPPGDKEITERAEPFRPFRSLFTLYLWQGFA